LTPSGEAHTLKHVFEAMRREKSNYVIQSVSHALDVLEAFRDSDGELGVTELSKRLKLHKNNVFRLLATLESRGYVEQNRSTENYRLGLGCLQLGRAYSEHMGLLHQSRPIMDELVAETGETAYVAVLREGHMVVVDAAEAPQVVRLASPLGSILPLHASAVGKCLLAAAPSDDDLRTLLPGTLERYTDRTPTDLRTLRDQLKHVASAGYAIDMGEHRDDVRAVAVPVRDYTRAVVACLAVAGPIHRFQGERLEKELAPVAVRAGLDLSARLGFEGSAGRAARGA
jgi:IclR family KDG regulon transcriptional repressor